MVTRLVGVNVTGINSYKTDYRVGTQINKQVAHNIQIC